MVDLVVKVVEEQGDSFMLIINLLMQHLHILWLLVQVLLDAVPEVVNLQVKME